MKSIVTFAYAQHELPSDPRLPGVDRVRLFAEVADLGARPYATYGGEEAYQHDAVTVHSLASGESSQVNPEELGLIVNRLNRSFNKDRAELEQLPRMLNENGVRPIGWRKVLAYQEVLEPLDLGIPTALLESAQSAEQFAADHPYDTYTVSPAFSDLNIKQYHLGRTVLTQFCADNPELLQKHIIRPQLDASAPFPSYVRPYDTRTSQRFREANRTDKKEIRVFGFLLDNAVQLFPIGHVPTVSPDGKVGRDWFFVDPDTLPNHLYEDTTKALQRTAALSESLAVYGAVDYGFGSLVGEPARWHAKELRVLSPAMVAEPDHPKIAAKLRGLLAEQISGVITAVNA